MRAFLQWEKMGLRNGSRVGFILTAAFAFFLLLTPFAAKADLASCRTCMTGCHRDYPAETAVACFAVCSDPSVGRPCQGVDRAEASRGFGSAGSGVRSSRVTAPAAPSGAQPAGPAANCVDVAVRATRVTADEANALVSRSGRQSNEWSCQRTCTEAQVANCMRGGCPSNPDQAVLCCPPAGGIAIGERCGARGAASETGAATGEGGAAAPAGAAGTAAPAGGAPASPSTEASAASSGGIASRLTLPGCIDTGNCQVSDLLDTGLNLIRFLFGLAGVLLLIVFLYAGIEYLLADTFGSVKAAKERIGKAVTGIAIMFFGYTLIKFLVNLLVR